MLCLITHLVWLCTALLSAQAGIRDLHRTLTQRCSGCRDHNWLLLQVMGLGSNGFRGSELAGEARKKWPLGHCDVEQSQESLTSWGNKAVDPHLYPVVR
jgi:hypothetical protein